MANIGPSSFGSPSYTRADKAIALFRLSFACCFFIIGCYSLVRFYRSRWILDIRTRSAYLVMCAGTCVLLAMLVSINGAVNVVWDGSGLRWFWSSLVLFFITPALLGSYICRALRLAVVFHPKAKRALPWLIPERNYLAVLLIGSLTFTAIPIYDEYTLATGDIIPKQTGILAWVSIAFAVVQACLYPFIRKVDDLFSISTELAIVTAAVGLLALAPKVIMECGGVYEERWLGNNVSSFLAASLFGISVIDPLRRLAFDPLAATKRNYADRILLSRQDPRSAARTASGVSSGIGGDSQDEGRVEEGRGTRATVASGRHCCSGISRGKEDPAPPHFEPSNTFAPATAATAVHGGVRKNSGGGGGGARGRSRVGSGTMEMEVWDFERLGRTPLLAAAFEDFSRKALCHESVLFLSEVSRYQDGDYYSTSSSSPSQFGTFCYITEKFIKAGSVEEVNISDADKKRVVNLYNAGQASFEGIDEEEQRMVFMQAYVEVRQMLEANLLRRFLMTDRFKSVREQRENIQLLMDSPQQTETVV